MTEFMCIETNRVFGKAPPSAWNALLFCYLEQFQAPCATPRPQSRSPQALNPLPGPHMLWAQEPGLSTTSSSTGIFFCFGLQEKSHGAGYWTETSYAPTCRPHLGPSLNHSLLPAIMPQLWMVAFLPLSLQQRQELLEFSKNCGSSREEKKKGREKRKERRHPTWQLNGTSLNPATSSTGTCCVPAHKC